MILAGGVTWILDSVIGDAALAESILEAPEDADGHEDDSKCPEKEKCSDCGGHGNMCTTGSNAGCACDQDECPDPKPSCSDDKCKGNDENVCTNENAGCPCDSTCPDEKPQCSDPKCQGDDNQKCTKELSGCSCEEAGCPTGKDTLICDLQCGGSQDGKCLGVADKDNKYKGCECLNLAYQSSPFELDPGLLSQYADNYAHLPKLSWSSFDLYEATCQKSGYGAPQADSDGSPSVLSSIKDWCSRMDGHTVTKQPKGVDTLFQMYSVNFYSYWLSANSWYSSPNSCGDTSKVTKDECIQVLTTAMDACDPNSGTTHGASFPGQCIQYNITLSNSIDPTSPPWNPVGEGQRPKCDLLLESGVAYNFFQGIYPQFCSIVDKDSSKQVSADFKNTAFKSPSSRRDLLGRTPPASPNQYDGFRFHFDWTGGNNCRFNCGHTGGEQNGMSLTSKIDAGCGTYSYIIFPHEENCWDNSDATEDYYTSYDSIISNIGTFCDSVSDQASKGNTKDQFIYTQTYQSGTPDTVDFRAYFDKAVSSVDAGRCKTLLKNKVDGCLSDSNQDNHNPMKWFHGGEFIDDPTMVYQIVPGWERHSPPPTGPYASGMMSYSYIANSFWVQGWGWASSDWGAGILPMLRGCGALTSWNFRYYSRPSNIYGFEWQLSGDVPIGAQQWGCLADRLRWASNNDSMPFIGNPGTATSGFVKCAKDPC
ncbi:MAG: hypothetical protein Q9227_007287 [Pyrenula ochraceoflavens]